MEMCGQAVTWPSNLPNVPFPEPGAPYNNTARGLEARKTGSNDVIQLRKNNPTMPKTGVHEFGPPEE